jgi:hypothetical protein
MLSRYLYLAGAVPFLMLGVAHVLHTPTKPGQARGLSPRDPSLASAMTSSPVRLTGATTVWKAWVGFNLSHSLGAITFALYVLLTARDAVIYLFEAPVAVPLAAAIALGYVILAWKYWFRIPLAGAALALALFVSAEALRLTGR